MPLSDQRLVVEPTFPGAAGLMAIEHKPGHDDVWTMRNRWYSHRRRCDVFIAEREGKFAIGIEPAFHSITHALQTIGCVPAWGLEQEGRALELLGTMIRHHQMRQYCLTGMFLERSERSGIMYLFRRLKPTVALAADPGLPARDQMRILCCLCMHPIAYYAGSWAGAMVPTDDVVAHLAMMRGDEAMFWKRCNQHQPHRPEAGL